MTTRTIRTEADREQTILLIRNRKLPMTVTVESGQKRSDAQNRTQRKWHTEAAEQLGEYTAEEYRGQCKLHHGVPILRNEDEHFRERYDQVIRPLPYETKIQLMMVPFDFPVTRLMSKDQKRRYLDAVWTYYTGLGVRLTDPGALRYGARRG